MKTKRIYLNLTEEDQKTLDRAKLRLEKRLGTSLPMATTMRAAIQAFALQEMDLERGIEQ